MTDKQKLFISEYCKDFNATQAAIRAGYSVDTAGSIGNENLQKPEIREAIRKQLDDILEDNKDLAVRVVREYEKIAFAKITDYVNYSEEGLTFKSPDTLDTSAVESVQFDERETNTVKRIKLHDKIRALDSLSKYTGLYKDSPITVVNISTGDKRISELLNDEDVDRIATDE